MFDYINETIRFWVYIAWYFYVVNILLHSFFLSIFWHDLLSF